MPRREARRELPAQRRVDDGGVLDDAPEQEILLGEGREAGVQLRVAELLGAAAPPVGAEVEVHEAVAHGRERGLVDHRQIPLLLREEQQLQPLDPAGAHGARPAADRDAGQEIRRLHTRDLLPEDLPDTASDTVRAEHGLRAGAPGRL